MSPLQKMFILFLLNGLALGGAGACLAGEKRPEPPSSELLASSPFVSATFSYSREPEKTLVSISSFGMSGARYTVYLYGDNRLVFKKLYGEKAVEESTVKISQADTERILRICVDFGLAEWDMTRVQAKQLEKTGGHLYSGIPSDSVRDTILISLEDYSRGDYQVPHLEREIQFQGAFVANRLYPPILEIRGIVELRREIHRLREAAEGSGETE